DYGENITEKLLSRIAKNPIRPYNFSRSLKNITGYTTKQWHRETVEELKDLWKNQSSSIDEVNYTKVDVPPGKFPTAYLYPQTSEDRKSTRLNSSHVKTS